MNLIRSKLIDAKIHLSYESQIAETFGTGLHQLHQAFRRKGGQVRRSLL